MYRCGFCQRQRSICSDYNYNSTDPGFLQWRFYGYCICYSIGRNTSVYLFMVERCNNGYYNKSFGGNLFSYCYRRQWMSVVKPGNYYTAAAFSVVYTIFNECKL